MLTTIGSLLPLKRHPGGEISNRLRCAFVKGIVAQMGENCVIEKGAEIMEDSILGDGTAIGPNCMIGPNVIFKGHNMIGPNVHIYTTAHLYDTTAHSFKGSSDPKPVISGEQVWIGYGVIILPGVTIGNHTIIGAGSVVTKDIPSGVVAAGNPCTVKRVLDAEYYNSK